MSDSETDLRIEPGEREWTETAEELLDEAVDREEPVACSFDEFALGIPLRVGSDAPTAHWEFDGAVEITIEGDRGPMADWLRWWQERG